MIITIKSTDLVNIVLGLPKQSKNNETNASHLRNNFIVCFWIILKSSKYLGKAIISQRNKK